MKMIVVIAHPEGGKTNYYMGKKCEGVQTYFRLSKKITEA